jgi:hypothetical protein
MSQNDKVLRYLQEHKKMTSMDAINQLRITRLSARIADLRDRGVKIDSETVYKRDEDGNPIHYSVYTLVKENG